jgi:hypothetical protein
MVRHWQLTISARNDYFRAGRAEMNSGPRPVIGTSAKSCTSNNLFLCAPLCFETERVVEFYDPCSRRCQTGICVTGLRNTASSFASEVAGFAHPVDREASLAALAVRVIRGSPLIDSLLCPSDAARGFVCTCLTPDRTQLLRSLKRQGGAELGGSRFPAQPEYPVS